MKTILLNFISGFKKNYKTVIVAFIIACSLWIAISVLTFDTISNNISGIDITAQPTEYMSQNNLQITSEIMDKVTARIEGKRYDISDLSADDFTAEVDLSSVRSAGTYTLPLKVTSKSNRDLSITQIQPEQLSVTLDEIVSKEFPVVGTADISLPAEYYLDTITASPANITVKGPAGIINKITKVEAKSTLHGNISESKQTGSEILVYGANGQITDGFTLSTDNVTVNIPIFKQKELPLKFTIINAPTNFNSDSLKFKITPETITVAAPDESINNISAFEIGSIDLADITLNTATDTAQETVSYIPIPIPEGYKNLSGISNARIEWDFEGYDKQTFSIPSENITISNKPDNFDVNLITQSLDVTVIGPAESLASIAPSDITANVNLLGVQIHEGSLDVNATVQIKGAKQDCWVSGHYKLTISAVPVEEE